MKREQPKNGRKLLYIIAVLLGLLAGCAGPQLAPEQITQINVECNDDAICIVERTDAAMESLLVQLEYEREDRRNIEVDKLCALMLSCAADEHMIISKTWGRAGRAAHLDRHGECVITRRNKLQNYKCVTRESFREAMRRAGY